VAASACARPTPRPESSIPDGSPPERDAWEQEARGILSDALETLRTFEVFVAYRISAASAADQTMFAADPPSSTAWAEATHVVRGLHGRAEQLFQRVAGSPVDATFWRQRREFAESTQGLLDLGQSLVAYRARIDYLGPGGDGSGAWDVLDRAWALWETSAARWGVRRVESLSCA
jgi:hypothetical protein